MKVTDDQTSHKDYWDFMGFCGVGYGIKNSIVELLMEVILQFVHNICCVYGLVLIVVLVLVSSLAFPLDFPSRQLCRLNT